MVMKKQFLVLLGVLLISNSLLEAKVRTKKKHVADNITISSLQEANKKSKGSAFKKALPFSSSKKTKKSSVSATQTGATQRKVSLSRSKTHEIEQAREHEAKQTDIPVPLGSRLIKNKIKKKQAYTTTHDNQQDHSSVMSYTTNMKEGDIALFYQQEMERLGWRQLASHVGDESYFIFDKPDKIVVVSLRAEGKGRRLVLYVSTRGNAFK